VYEPILGPPLVPNQVLRKDAPTVVGEGVSRKITDSPAAMLVIPFRATDDAKEFEASSIFQPLMLTAALPVLVSSNQSAA
jgi:hypothetical protein